MHGVAAVVGMKDRLPMLEANLSLRLTRKVVPALVEIIDFAIGTGGPDDLRHGIRELTEKFFACLKCLLCSPARGALPGDDQCSLDCRRETAKPILANVVRSSVRE